MSHLPNKCLLRTNPSSPWMHSVHNLKPPVFLVRLWQKMGLLRLYWNEDLLSCLVSKSVFAFEHTNHEIALKLSQNDDLRINHGDNILKDKPMRFKPLIMNKDKSQKGINFFMKEHVVVIMHICVKKLKGVCMHILCAHREPFNLFTYSLLCDFSQIYDYSLLHFVLCRQH